LSDYERVSKILNVTEHRATSLRQLLLLLRVLARNWLSELHVI